MIIATADIAMIHNKGYCRHCFSGDEIKPFSFTNTREGLTTFYRKIMEFSKAHHCPSIIVGFESTGCYGIPFMHFFKDKPVKLVQVNPFHTKRVKEIVDNSPNKNDDKDPRVIADIIALGRALRVVIPEGIIAELRALSTARERMLEHHTALCNQLRDIVCVVFPEFIHIMKNVDIVTSRGLLRQYTTPPEVVALGKEKLVYIIKALSRGQIKRPQAEALYEAAHTTIGVKEGIESMRLEILTTLSLVEKVQGFLEDIEQRLTASVVHVPCSRFLLSIHGIGPITAAGLIGEYANFSNFTTCDEVLKYAGMNLFEISSGKHKGEKHISKRGRPLIRKLLYLAVLNMIRSDGPFHAPYRSDLKRGMTKNKAIIKLARKLLRIIFALVRKQVPFTRDVHLQQDVLEAA